MKNYRKGDFMEGNSRVLAVAHTVFLYRVNVALAILMAFINVQIFLNIMFFVDPYDVTPNAPFISGGLLALALLYALHAFNSMIAKIIVYEDAIEYKTLFRRKYITAGDIDRVAFYRQNDKRLKITIALKDGKKFVIFAAKFKGNQSIIDFCSRFKKA